MLDVGEVFGHPVDADRPGARLHRARPRAVRADPDPGQAGGAAPERRVRGLHPARADGPHRPRGACAGRRPHSATWATSCTGPAPSARPPTPSARPPGGWPRRTCPASWSSSTARWGVLTDSDLRRKLVAEGLLLRHAGVAADGRPRDDRAARPARDRRHDRHARPRHPPPARRRLAAVRRSASSPPPTYVPRGPHPVRRAARDQQGGDRRPGGGGRELPAPDDRRADPCRRLVGGRLPGAGAGRRHRHHAAAGAGLPAPRGAALLVGMDGAGQRRPPRADAGLRPGQRASPTTTPAERRSTPTSRRSQPRSTTTWNGAASAPTTPT